VPAQWRGILHQRRYSQCGRRHRRRRVSPMSSIAVCNDDVFSHEAVRNARTADDRLRELAPAVRLSRENITMLGRYEHVSEGLRDWRTFSSTSRPWHDPKSVRPELLLVDDPPKHTGVRAVIASALSPRALAKMAE